MSTRHCRFVIVFVLVAANFAFSQEPAETVLFNGKILTVDSNFGIAEAVAVRGDRIAVRWTRLAADQGYTRALAAAVQLTCNASTQIQEAI